MIESIRVRHGVFFDPVLGLYRAVREWDGERSYIGPWCITEAQAQANADTATRIFHEVIDEMGVEKARNPISGLWEANP